MSEQDIIDEFISYQISFVEQASPWNPRFNICPFARKARLENRILYKVMALSADNCTAEGSLAPIKEFAAQSRYMTMIYIMPSRPSLAALEGIMSLMKPHLDEMGVEAFLGHPEHEYAVHGISVRREPFATLQFLTSQMSRKTTEGLAKAGYFDEERKPQGDSGRPR